MYAIFFGILLLLLLLFVKETPKTCEKMVEALTNSTSDSDNESSSTYQPYSGDNPIILAQKNAANIQYLEGRLKDLQTLTTNFNTLEGKVTKNTDAIKQMAKLAANHITQTTGVSTTTATPSALHSVSSIGQAANNMISSASAPVTNVTPSTQSN